jgi:hypothetical protein
LDIHSALLFPKEVYLEGTEYLEDNPVVGEGDTSLVGMGSYFQALELESTHTSQQHLDTKVPEVDGSMEEGDMDVMDILCMVGELDTC